MAAAQAASSGLDPAWIVAAVTLFSAVGGVALWLGRAAWRLTRRTSRFLDDYFGEPAHDGLPATLGVMARLTAVENMVRDVAGQVHLNSGHTMRDEVQAIQRDTEEIKRKVARMEAKS